MKPSIFIPIIGLLLFVSCNSGHEVAMSKNHDKQKKAIKKIVFIEPDFLIKDFRKKITNRYIKSDEKDENFRTLIRTNAKKAGLSVVVKDKTSLKKDDAIYYSDLMPLKTTILNNVSYVDSKLKEKKGIGNNNFRAAYSLLRRAPLIDADYSQLMEEYGTEYFAVTGVLTLMDKPSINYLGLLIFPPVFVPDLQLQKKSFYYLIVANVKSGEVIYEEVRHCKERMHDTNLNIYLYDSFKIINAKRK